MRTKTTTALCWLCCLTWIGLAWTGCYPDGDTIRLSISLGLDRMGLDVDEQALGSWLDWQAGPRQEPFTMNTTDRNFFLGLQLEAPDESSSLELVGGSVIHNGADLEVYLQMSECLGCTFDLVIFQAPLELQTYEGSSAPFDAIPGGPEVVVEMEAELASTGTIVCETDDSVGTVYLAALDEAENVRFPVQQGMLGTGGGQVVLLDIPVGRQMMVQIGNSEQGPFETIDHDVVVDEPGSEVLVAF